VKRYQQDQLGTLAPAVAHLQKATTSYWDGLFAYYQVKDLPRTNNNLEHFFGAAHHAERHITGRKQASSTLVAQCVWLSQVPAAFSPFQQRIF
jgi:hypothetical protein